MAPHTATAAPMPSATATTTRMACARRGTPSEGGGVFAERQRAERRRVARRDQHQARDHEGYGEPHMVHAAVLQGT